MDLVILERKDRDNGTSHMWISLGGERARLVINTATLNAPEGFNTLKLMATKAVDDVKAARVRGQLKLES